MVSCHIRKHKEEEKLERLQAQLGFAKSDEERNRMALEERNLAFVKKRNSQNV